MTDVRQKAREGLEAAVDEAIKTVQQDVSGKLPYVRGSTRAQTARWLLEVVLERLPADHSAPLTTMKPDELFAARERLKLIRKQG